MAKFYSEYVGHMLRFYARTITKGKNPPVFNSEVDRMNWISCDVIVNTYNDADKDIILSVYSGYDTLADEIYNKSEALKINQNSIWRLIKVLHERIAKQRGLI